MPGGDGVEAQHLREELKGIVGLLRESTLWYLNLTLEDAAEFEALPL